MIAILFLLAGDVTFKLTAPKAQEVEVVGQWDKARTRMTKGADGVWSATVPLSPGIYEYSFTVDGLSILDPSNPDIKPQRLPRKSIVEVPGTPPLLTEFQEVPHGTVHVHFYQSKSLGRVRRMHVYTPPGYERGHERYPTLYLQHGSGDNDAAWTVHGHAHDVLDNLIAMKKARPMVVVMIDGHAMAPGAPDAREKNVAAFGRDLLEDVMPMVESTYRVRTDAASRALVGLSMGGRQALTVGLNHADRFAWVGSFSGGPPVGDEAKVLQDPAALTKKLKWLWIGIGKDDQGFKRNEEFVALLKEKGIRHVWFPSEGAHAWPVWRGYLIEVVPQLFAGK